MRTLFLVMSAIAASSHATVSSTTEDAIYLKCQGTYAINNAEGPLGRPSALVHVHKIASGSLSDLDNNIPGMSRWGFDRCASHRFETSSCALTPESLTLSNVSKNELGQTILSTKLTIDRIHGTFSEVTQFPLRNEQQVGSGTCVPIPNPLP